MTIRSGKQFESERSKLPIAPTEKGGGARKKDDPTKQAALMHYLAAKRSPPPCVVEHVWRALALPFRVKNFDNIAAPRRRTPSTAGFARAWDPNPSPERPRTRSRDGPSRIAPPLPIRGHSSDPDAPKTLKDAPRCSPRRPGTAPRRRNTPETAKDGPRKSRRRHTTAPRRAQEAPTRPQGAPGRSPGPPWTPKSLIQHKSFVSS